MLTPETLRRPRCTNEPPVLRRQSPRAEMSGTPASLVGVGEAGLRSGTNDDDRQGEADRFAGSRPFGVGSRRATRFLPGSDPSGCDVDRSHGSPGLDPSGLGVDEPPGSAGMHPSGCQDDGTRFCRNASFGMSGRRSHRFRRNASSGMSGRRSHRGVSNGSRSNGKREKHPTTRHRPPDLRVRRAM
jgi:hypothetical protein